jgi:hypothetical protein
MRPHDRVQEAAAQNPLVPLALGLVAALGALDALLTDVADPSPDRLESPALAADDPIVLAALGVVALRRVIGGWLDVAVGEPRDRSLEEGIGAATDPGDMAR